MTTGMPRFIALVTGPTSAESSSGASRDTGHPTRDRVLDLGHLRVAIVLAQRTSPHDRDVQLLRGLLGAGMDALPERVRRSLRNDRDGHPAVVLWAGAGGREEGGCQNTSSPRDDLHVSLSGNW